MSYCFESRVRYSEVGENQCLSLNSLINYFQDTSTFHSEDIGIGWKQLDARGRRWVLSSWQIEIRRFPELGEKILVKTWPYGFRGFIGYRNFTMETPEGEMLACANSIWCFTDVATGRPIRPSEEDVAGYVDEPQLDMKDYGRKVPVPEGTTDKAPFPVRQYHLDTNHHVNNGQYIQMASAFIPRGFAVARMRAEYKQQAFLGDMIFPKVKEEDNIYTVALCAENGQPYAVVEFA